MATTGHGSSPHPMHRGKRCGRRKVDYNHHSRRPDNMSYEPVIGLEIHAQLQTESKLFCGCSTQFGAAPNTHLPGLPGAARRACRCSIGRAVELADQGRAGARLHGARAFDLRAQELFLSGPAQGLPDFAVRQPLATEGELEFEARGAPRASASSASTSRRTPASRCTKVCPTRIASTALDFNRSGVPLIEIVSRARRAHRRRTRPSASAALRDDPRRDRRHRRQHGGGQSPL